MTHQEIKQKIDQNNARIREILCPDMFIHNKEVSELMTENYNLRKICKHEFQDGYCKYCYTPEE